MKSGLGILRTMRPLACWLAVAGCFAPLQPTSTASFEFVGSLNAGEPFEHSFGKNYRFILKPQEFGWNIVVKEHGRDEHLQRLTPPLHFVPNPTWIEGWHFRNEDNTGPNDGTVNAPQREREFFFSPEVGRSIQGPDATMSPTADEVARIRSFGRGLLHITHLELSPPRQGEKATIRRMTFRCAITINDRKQTRR